MKVAVIGGGWAGLAAALELSLAGLKPVLFEAAKQLGGRARSVDLDGHRLDNGQHILLGAYHETLRLMRLFDADAESSLAQRLKRLPLALHFPARKTTDFHLALPLLPAPLNLAVGLFCARGASWVEKIRALKFIRFLQKNHYQLDADICVSELLDKHAQHGALRHYLWDALCLAALNTPAARASAQIFANTLRDSLGGRRADTDLLLPRLDLDQLFALPAEALIRAHGGQINLSTRVKEFSSSSHPGKPGITLLGEVFDQVILAVAPQHAAKILAEHVSCADLAQLLASYTYEPTVTVYMAYPPELRLPLPMLGLGKQGDKHAIGQWVFDRGALGGKAGLMAFVLSAYGAQDGSGTRDNETLASTLHQELREALQDDLPTPLWYRVIREQRATFSCRPNLARPPMRTAISGLWLAGDYVCADYPATLEGAVRSGVAAARAVLQQQDFAQAGLRDKPQIERTS
ncbi:MAG: hydroxysqualene dehydroxylase HpnE [Pseudomonadota bacterium]